MITRLPMVVELRKSKRLLYLPSVKTLDMALFRNSSFTLLRYARSAVSTITSSKNANSSKAFLLTKSSKITYFEYFEFYVELIKNIFEKGKVSQTT